jgi:hypothetical protein
VSYVRGQAAYVEETIRRYLTEQLAVLGWQADPGTTALPYGATAAVTLIDYLPKREEAVAENTVAMTSGDEQDDAEAELGAASGGLFSTERVYFIDVFGESPGIALRLADDIKAIFTGKLTGTQRYQPVRDFVNGGNLDGHVLHFETVVRSKPVAQDYKRDWQVVKLTAVHEFSATEYGAAVGSP